MKKLIKKLNSLDYSKGPKRSVEFLDNAKNFFNKKCFSSEDYRKFLEQYHPIYKKSQELIYYTKSEIEIIFKKAVWNYIKNTEKKIIN